MFSEHISKKKKELSISYISDLNAIHTLLKAYLYRSRLAKLIALHINEEWPKFKVFLLFKIYSMGGNINSD